ncbi:DUF2516 family protein [Nocardioides sp. TRM66260-LWL]|uniref:DUF2516 family protein n=1 Tax=Nocardioides sp. TRM66260-LWL TaxID=2874478 RepID=UPI001CC76263|nr:DUF2516 family protein [Nocardioides sp. TRM66260-LWL]MBZ5734944.1 DUF2516 family protein [Nocardioides sp. TRM66260-LWL]
MFESVYEVQSGLSLIVFVAFLAVKLFAFVSALLFEARAYEAANKLTKPAWVLITGLGIVTHLISIGPLVSIGFLIAAFVFILDVRPALRGLYRR